jgi:hypothetical protein
MYPYYVSNFDKNTWLSGNASKLSSNIRHSGSFLAGVVVQGCTGHGTNGCNPSVSGYNVSYIRLYP